MGSIRLLTEIPGPKSQALMKRATASVARALQPLGGVFAERGEGAVLQDVDGNRYIDFVGGVGCLVVGHSHPRIIESIRSQADRLLHTDFSVLPYESYVELAERIAARLAGDTRVVFFNTGAEAVENAVKIARFATGKPGMICFEGAFHGRTYMALSLTSREVPHKEGFGPFMSEVYRAPYPNLGGATIEDSLQQVDRLLGNRAVAGIIVEPVLGEGGFVVPPDDFLPSLRALASRAGALLITDEIQCGYGRCGSFSVSSRFGVVPDLTLLGKSIASGLPLSAVAGNPEFLDSPVQNSLGGTFPGNPLACAAGVAVLDILDREGLIERAETIGDRLRKEWESMAAPGSGIVDVRGLGSMVGVEFSDSAGASRFIKESRNRGLLFISAGREGRVVRHLMPLVITDDQLDEAFLVVGEVVRTG